MLGPLSCTSHTLTFNLYLWPHDTKPDFFFTSYKNEQQSKLQLKPNLAGEISFN